MMKKRGIVTAILAAAALAVTGCAETAGQAKESAAAITTQGLRRKHRYPAIPSR